MADQGLDQRGGLGASSWSAPSPHRLLPALLGSPVSPSGAAWETGLQLTPTPVCERLGMAARPSGLPWGGGAVGICVIAVVGAHGELIGDLHAIADLCWARGGERRVREDGEEIAGEGWPAATPG